MAWDLEWKDAKKSEGPVVCLGMTFANEAERRAFFTEELRNQLPTLKQWEGFPKGTDEDILALSDPPYYTACPNPFIPQIIAEWTQERQAVPEEAYIRDPYAADVSEGKNDPIYNAHSYHTKVPHKAIMRYILHYTNPGDIVFDGFAGTGMTGVAAQLCGDRKTVESLGYRVDPDGTILSNEDDNATWKPISHLGARHAILNDLSPAASFIAYNYNTPTDPIEFKAHAEKILQQVERECGWMYATLPDYATAEQRQRAMDLLEEEPSTLLAHQEIPWGHINYTVWSDVFVCPHCATEMVFWDVAVDQNKGKVQDEFFCPHCHALLTKKKIDRAWVTEYDAAIHETVRHAKQVPVLINYSVGKKRREKVPDAFDRKLLEVIDKREIPYWFPTDRMPEGYNTRQPRESHGITHVHQFYTKANLLVMSSYLANAKDLSQLNLHYLVLTSLAIYASKLSRWRLENKSGPLSGTLYISSTVMPLEAKTILPNRIKRLLLAKQSLNITKGNSLVSTQSLYTMRCSDNSVDYVFVDPPFGANIMYSELNFLWEAWLKVFTNNQSEAIVNSVQHKTLLDYQRLMTQSFSEAFRVLKPGRWMTVEFSNTQTAVWNAITQAIQQAGFVIANVAALNKQQGSFKAVTTTTAVRQDLVISAYKPSQDIASMMDNPVDEEQSVWRFVEEHLRHLPVFLGKRGRAEVITERTPRNIYDRLVSYYVARGWALPITTSGDFQAELLRRYPVREGMIFLEDQVAEYDQKRILVKALIQADLFVSNESTAIEWIRQQLLQKPQTYQDLQPEFMKSIQHLDKYENLPELSVLLEQSFLKYDGEGPIPEQIAAYLRNNYRTYRGENVTADMRTKAKGYWYVPDPRKMADLEKLREKALWKEFEQVMQDADKSTKKLKVFRLEVMRAGFKRLYMEKQFATIVKIGETLPANVVAEDLFLSQFVDNARLMLE